MHRGFPAVAVLLAIVVVAVAASAPARTADEFTSDALRAGSWSIDFSILDNFQIGSFEGAAISATRHTSPRGAWRYGLTFSGTMEDAEIGRSALTDSVPLPIQDEDGDVDEFSIGVDVLRLMYPEVSGRVHPYLGVGPTFSVGHFKETRHVDQTSIGGPTTDLEQETSNWSAGAQFVLGVEVFAARRVSILGQYGASLIYRHLNSTFSNRRTFPGGSPSAQGEDSEATTNRWRLGQDSVRFGVSAYF
jgi:hypothetical protein